MEQGAEQGGIQELPANVSAKDAFLSQSVGELAERWIPKKEEAVAEEKVAAADEEKEEAVVEERVVEEAVEEAVEEETVAEEKVEEEKPAPLLTSFELLDERGELEIPRNLKFNFKANGKEYKEVPLDKVVLMAQQGAYNHEKEQRYKQIEQEVPQVKQEAERLREENAQYDSYLKRMMEDDVFREAAIEEYQRINTPEAKLRRLEAERAQEQQVNRQRQEDQMIASFTQSVMVPAFSKLLSDNPKVSHYELVGRFTELTAPYMVRGRIPVERLSYVAQIIDADLAAWAKSVQIDREHDVKSRTAELEKTKKEVVQAKRQVARVVAPKGGASPGNASKAKPTKSASEWFNKRFATPDEE